MKDELFLNIESNRNKIIEMMDYIYDNPELGTQEYKASKLLTDYLTQNGFEVECGIGGFDTAFRAIYESGANGPSIGLLCEYDAIEGMGHACAHHMQGPAIVAAVKSLKEVLTDVPFKLVVYGTPAEETISGKIQMIDQGCFKDIDVAFMMHGAPTTTTDVRSLALSNFTVNFHGVSSHAALKPEQGRSALDSILLLLQGVEFLREHVRDDVRIHYVITDGGSVANVVPKFASADFSLRAFDRPYLDEVIKRFEKVINGASLMTETEYEIIHKKSLHNKIPVLSINKLLMDNAKLVDAPNIRPPRTKTGSTDFGNVMHHIPGSCIRVSFVEEGVSSHSDVFLEEGRSQRAHDAAITAAKVLASSSFDIISNEEILAEIKNEFRENKAQSNMSI